MHLREPVGMRSQDGDISRLRIGVIQRNILLHGEMELVLLFMGSRSRVLADMLAFNGMLDHPERARRKGGRHAVSLWERRKCGETRKGGSESGVVGELSICMGNRHKIPKMAPLAPCRPDNEHGDAYRGIGRAEACFLRFPRREGGRLRVPGIIIKHRCIPRIVAT